LATWAQWQLPVAEAREHDALQSGVGSSTSPLPRFARSAIGFMTFAPAWLRRKMN
jgi:hypothetical protein